MLAKQGKDTVLKRYPPDLPSSAEELTLITEPDLAGPIEESRMSGLDLSGRKLSGFSVKLSIFEGVNFAGCTIPSPRFRDVRLVKCDLSNAMLRGFEATRVEFIDCRLTGMIAIGCRWQDVLIENCDARYLQLTDGKIRSGEFKGSNFSEADFRGADLEGAIFTAVALNQADLSRSRLQGADLRGAEMEGIVVGPEEVRGAIVSATQAMDLARLLGLVIK